VTSLAENLWSCFEEEKTASIRGSDPIQGHVLEQQGLPARCGDSDRMPPQHWPSILESGLVRGARAADHQTGRVARYSSVLALTSF
jgi:hypothetical protein